MSKPMDLSLSTEEIRKLNSEDRMEYVSYIRILYPRAQKILKRIRYCMKANLHSADPKGIMLLGPAGAGKTTLLEIILYEFPRQLTETGTIIPVIMAMIDSPATIGSLSSRLLQALGDPRYANGTIFKRMDRTEHLIDDCKVQMVMLDELQHVVDRESKKILQTVSDAIKNLIKTKHVACVLAGLEGEAEQVVNSNPQLARLFSDPIYLGPFEWNDQKPNTILEFCTLLSEIEKKLPLRDPSKLHERHLAYRVFVATGGLMGYVMMLIREATLVALDRGQESLTIDLLAEVFDLELAKERRGLQNPFKGPLPDHKPIADRSVEPAKPKKHGRV